MIGELIIALIAAAIGGSRKNQIERLGWWLMAIGAAGRLFSETGSASFSAICNLIFLTGMGIVAVLSVLNISHLIQQKKRLEAIREQIDAKGRKTSAVCMVTITYQLTGEPAERIQSLALSGEENDIQEQLAIVQKAGHAALDGKNGGCRIECEALLEKDRI